MNGHGASDAGTQVDLGVQPDCDCGVCADCRARQLSEDSFFEVSSSNPSLPLSGVLVLLSLVVAFWLLLALALHYDKLDSFFEALFCTSFLYGLLTGRSDDVIH